ncbi:hypothetical protein F511_27632 [Dorcoceras hygrometricum]|uniref:Uncharacterized protein n=1 Tax=Dorcoceras hygrometricum TaxID=472368 RepID=A0A2Z7D7F0_9LAMI|nr:hypothetical protein F511_27632 [Dorcoceras hygrometricum]
MHLKINKVLAKIDRDRPKLLDGILGHPKSTRSVFGKCVYIVTLVMSLFDLQDVRIAIISIATLDLPMVVDLIGIYVLKGPYCRLTTTNWFLQALSVIPRGSWGDVARRFTMIRWATPMLAAPSSHKLTPSASSLAPPPSAASCRDRTCSDQLDGEFPSVLNLSVLLVQADEARRLDASKVAIYEHPIRRPPPCAAAQHPRAMAPARPRLIADHWALTSRMEAGRLLLVSCTTLCDLPMDIAPLVGASSAMRRTRCGKRAAERRTLHGGGGLRHAAAVRHDFRQIVATADFSF